MDREEVRAWKRGLEAVNDYEIEETRGMSAASKLRAIEGLRLSAREFGWDSALRQGEEETWKRWQDVREAWRARHP